MRDEQFQSRLHVPSLWRVAASPGAGRAVGVKLIRCEECGDPVALSRKWRNCDCGRSGGAYGPDGDRAVIAGPCGLYGISNKIFLGVRADAWPYDETNGKIERLAKNRGCFPERAAV